VGYYGCSIDCGGAKLVVWEQLGGYSGRGMAKKPIGTFAVSGAAATAYIVGAHVIPRMIPQPYRSEIDHAIGWIVGLAMLALLGCALFYLLRARYRARSD
jgi:hypothetical protein